AVGIAKHHGAVSPRLGHRLEHDVDEERREPHALRVESVDFEIDDHRTVSTRRRGIRAVEIGGALAADRDARALKLQLEVVLAADRRAQREPPIELRKPNDICGDEAYLRESHVPWPSGRRGLTP